MADPRMFPSGSDDRAGSSEAGRRLYNPYQDLNMPYSYRTLYDLPTSPEFLFIEEDRVQRRSWAGFFITHGAPGSDSCTACERQYHVG